MSTATNPAHAPSLPLPGPEGLPMRRISGAEYDRMVELGVLNERPRCYLLRGVICQKMTEHPPHVFALTALRNALDDRLDRNLWTIRQDHPLTLAPDDRPEPDLAVARGPFATYAHRHPSPGEIGLLVEVAHTSYSEDVRVMLPGYAAASISLCWIVNIPVRRVEVYRNPRFEGGVGVYDAPELYPVGSEVPLELDGRAYPPIPVAGLIPEMPAAP